VTDDSIFLQTAGDRIATRSGHPVSLRGVSLGGWMNMDALADSFRFDRCDQRRRLRDTLRAAAAAPAPAAA
jgi:hypothetical protein